jgi:excisionase family DNA binding protein
MTDVLWNVRDAAEYLKTTPQGVYKLVERRQIPHVRLGKRVLFDPKKIRAWIERQAIENKIENA